MYKKVAVIGAGVMGSGIAAQIANNNIEVFLFDLENDKGLIAKQAIDKQLGTNPSGFTHPSISKNVTPLSLTKDLSRIAECDLIIEAIIEKIDVKQKLYNDLFKYLKHSAIIVSNTSTICLNKLTLEMGDLANRIAVCHFFNPPRFLRLIELIPGGISSQERHDLTHFLTDNLGREVIICKDRPGFIVNRLGCYFMNLTLSSALGSKFTIEEIDAALTQFCGFPSTGVFGLFDLIGLDVMGLISTSLKNELSAEDKFAIVTIDVPQIDKMVQDGYNGRKGKGGFYKQEVTEDGKKVKHALNISNWQYDVAKKISFEQKTASEFFASNSELSLFIKSILEKFFSYSAAIAYDICDDLYSIDKAMQLGMAWKYGPFELMHMLNMVPENAKKMDYALNNLHVGVNCKSLQQIVHRLALEPIFSSSSSKTWHINEHKVCFELTGKMNILSIDVFESMIKAADFAESKGADLIIYSDTDHFCAGADLKLINKMVQENDKEGAEKYLDLGQKALTRLKYLRVPVISCPRGIALGGGCELLLHSDYIVAHQDLQAGLVEMSIGLIPAWGGVKEMIVKASTFDKLNHNLSLVAKAYKSSSALDFAINYDMNNVKSLANRNNLLDYALKNKFEKRKIEFFALEGGFIDIDADDEPREILERFSDVIMESKREAELFLEERKIFLELMFLEKSKAKIKAIVG